ncbi:MULTISPECIES: HAD-IC family P-type ATPase [unclassified Roseitalea]|uniref:cation-translocating P-type ATPase n=1 Tax=unclassified Roseitalea TaxID=2639107 RepID=UPI00273DD437|nr:MULTISPECIES: HAD-IC family P-type ATPase [unclassified Roseitalea]
MPEDRTRLSVVHARVPGRLRVRVPSLIGRPDRAEAVRTHLAARLDIERVSVSTTTGSVLLNYPARLDAGTMVDLLRQALAEALWGKPPRQAGADRAPAGARIADPDTVAWHSQSPERVATLLDTSLEHGLGSGDARGRLRRDGPNALPRQRGTSALALAFKQVNTLPVGMLTVSAVVSAATGGVGDSVATMGVVAVNALLGYVTEGQAERAIQALVDDSTLKVTVKRDGNVRRIASSGLVRGDVIEVRAGEQVTADARLVADRTLRIDESTLTGETFPVTKGHGAGLEDAAPIVARPTMLHAGTIVAEGWGRAVVVATGARTQAARIALVSQSTVRPQAPLEGELDALARTLAKIAVGACGLYFGIGVLRGRRLVAMLRDALALAVAAVPEGMPVVATTTMALGLGRMQRKGMLIRQIPAVQSLGALQTVCVDKTGTMTINRMTVVAAVAGVGDVPLDDRGALSPLVRAAALNNDAASNGEHVQGSSATERTLIDFARGQGADVDRIRADRPRLSTMERGVDRPWMATFHAGGEPSVFVKGAPDAVLRLCTDVGVGTGARPLTEADRERILERNDAIAARPARVLGFAQGCDGRAGELPDRLTWLGLVGMVDPLRPGAQTFVSSLRDAGIDTVMITGDQAATASAIARDLGLGRDGTIRVIDSTELAGLAPELQAELVARTDVFARASAHDKLAIVKALQTGGRVVGMTGDGVNDGPALKASDIGIAMGASGADLAREVANVVIRDDKLETLVDAISEGRTVYANIRRALNFLITTNMSEIMVGLVEALHGPGELETPMELLWINLATDILPGLGLALAPPSEDAMLRPPRAAEEPIIAPRQFRRMTTDASIIAAAALGAHFVGLGRYGPGPRTRAMTFLSLSVGQLLFAFISQRQDLRKLRMSQLLANPALDAAMLGSLGLAVAPFGFPGLRRLLGVAPLTRTDAMIALLAGIAPAATIFAGRGIERGIPTREQD